VEVTCLDYNSIFGLMIGVAIIIGLVDVVKSI
jgi:hypothetical protein